MNFGYYKMKKLIFILSLLILSACTGGDDYYAMYDCGDNANKQLVKESFESCMKTSASTSSTCAEISQKLFCEYKRVKINKEQQ